jgi:hypothetical protein
MSINSKKSQLDSALIRTDVLKRSQVTTQPEAPLSTPAATELNGKSIRVDIGQRELLKHPFDGVK